MVQRDRECWKRRGTLEETMNTRREAKKAQGSEAAGEPGERVRHDRAGLVPVGGDWVCVGVQAGVLEGVGLRGSREWPEILELGLACSARQSRTRMLWFAA